MRKSPLAKSNSDHDLYDEEEGTYDLEMDVYAKQDQKYRRMVKEACKLMGSVNKSTVAIGHGDGGSGSSAGGGELWCGTTC